MAYTMRRYRVNETEVVAGIAINTKSRKSSRELNHLVVSSVARHSNSQEPLKDAFDSHTHTAREEAFLVALEVATKYKLDVPSPHHTLALHAYAMTFKQEYVEDYETRLLLDDLKGMRPPGSCNADSFRPR